MKNLLIAVILLLTVPVSPHNNVIEEDYPSRSAIVYTMDTLEVSYKLPSKRELEFAARLIQAESRNESVVGQIAVVQTMMNRSEWNGTSFIYEITRPGQVDGYKTRNWYSPISEDILATAWIALVGERIVPKTVYFWHNECISTDLDHVRSTEGENGQYVWTRIDNHTFCHGRIFVENKTSRVYTPKKKLIVKYE